jgi:hypothetical protein
VLPAAADIQLHRILLHLGVSRCGFAFSIRKIERTLGTTAAAAIVLYWRNFELQQQQQLSCYLESLPARHRSRQASFKWIFLDRQRQLICLVWFLSLSPFSLVLLK